MRIALSISVAALSLLQAAPASAQAPHAPSGRLLVVSQGDGTLMEFNPSTGEKLGRYEEGITTMVAHEVAVSPDGRTAYLPIYGSAGVGKPGLDGSKMYRIDVASGKTTATLDFGHGVRPHCVIYDRTSGMLYVTTELDKAITIVDPNTFKIVGQIPTTQEQSHMLAISHDGTRGYTANVGPGTVSVLDLKARKLITVIPISGNTQRIAVSKDDSMAFTADQTSPRLAVIDTATNKLKTWIDLPALGYGSTATKDGQHLLLTLLPASQLASINLKTLKIERTLPVCSRPQEVVESPDGKHAYVSCIGGHQIAVVNLADWKVERMLDAGEKADGMAFATGTR